MSDWGEEVDNTPMPPVAWSNGTDGPPAAPAFNSSGYNNSSSGGFSLSTGDWGTPDRDFIQFIYPPIFDIANFNDDRIKWLSTARVYWCEI